MVTPLTFMAHEEAHLGPQGELSGMDHHCMCGKKEEPVFPVPSGISQTEEATGWQWG